MKLALPFARQHTVYSCGPASLEMVFAFFGDKKDEASLIKKAHTNEVNGTKHEWMINVARQEGFYCYVNSFSSIHEIRHFISLDLPVIVDYTEPTSGDGHYAVVVGYKKDQIILNDPWNGRDFSLSEKEFIERWKDRLTKSHGWVMIVSKKDFQLGKQYLPIEK